MEANTNSIEALLIRAAEYGKTSLELIKLKALEKTSDLISSFIPHSIVFILIAFFIIFSNVGLALWLGDLMGKTFFGFFIVAAFYVVSGIIIHLMHKRLKRRFFNYIINQILK